MSGDRPHVDPPSQAVYLPKEPPPALIEAMETAVHHEVRDQAIEGRNDSEFIAKAAYAALRAWLGLED